ncbi:MAG: tryptophan 2,3-dioxygenase [Wenzhouxiangellaceae bacterium]|jgi:tryptophan 2,3-dioxygenase|nr:tryptophan 2,3-dioxygenase [Wenzhouxiangellaceae bacterium]MBS3746870.1 tryptophan 2,3-dioxygenase [Wenzhouxiangellaceae bacterium]MBS3824378.1 tryptophan 2,3-dioxygenase [Wenzhouxiangellaceae bacterium]
MSDQRNRRELEAGIETELGDRLDYQDYLGLDRVLDAQRPLSDPPHHDEMLFIIQHQTAELWFKLIIHELKAAISHLAADDPSPCLKILARVKMVQQQLFDQWAVLETLTPSEYMQFRDVLGSASGFQSFQYRSVEFLLGNKNGDMIRLFRHQPEVAAELRRVLESPSVYDEFLRYLARRGLDVPPACIDRDFSQPHAFSSELVDVLVEIYRNTSRWWSEYALCERLVDVEESFQLWRYRHLKSVERIIGHKTGTGGSSGVGFLEKALSLRFFPELMEVRTRL